MARALYVSARTRFLIFSAAVGMIAFSQYLIHHYQQSLYLIQTALPTVIVSQSRTATNTVQISKYFTQQTEELIDTYHLHYDEYLSFKWQMDSQPNDAKCLIIILSQLRFESSITFISFYNNFLKIYNCDLAISVGIDLNETINDYEDDLYLTHSSYIWYYHEPAKGAPDYSSSWNELCDDLYSIIIANHSHNPMHPCHNISKHGDNWLAPIGGWKLYGGGRAAGGAQLVARQYANIQFIQNRLYTKYNYVATARMDQKYLCKMYLNINNDNIYIPDAQHWDGYNDRWMMTSTRNFIAITNVFKDIFLNEDDLIKHLSKFKFWRGKRNRDLEVYVEHMIWYQIHRCNLQHLVTPFQAPLYIVRHDQPTKPTFYDRKAGYVDEYEQALDLCKNSNETIVCC
eukprot:555692_1